MLEQLPCVRIDPAPLRPPPISKNMDERAIRFELERQACQSLRQGGIPVVCHASTALTVHEDSYCETCNTYAACWIKALTSSVALLGKRYSNWPKCALRRYLQVSVSLKKNSISQTAATVSSLQAFFSVIQVYFLGPGVKWIKYSTSGWVTVESQPDRAQHTLPWAHELSNLLAVAAWALDQSSWTGSSLDRFRQGQTLRTPQDFQRSLKCNEPNPKNKI